MQEHSESQPAKTAHLIRMLYFICKSFSFNIEYAFYVYAKGYYSYFDSINLLISYNNIMKWTFRRPHSAKETEAKRR